MPRSKARAAEDKQIKYFEKVIELAEKLKKNSKTEDENIQRLHATYNGAA